MTNLWLLFAGVWFPGSITSKFSCMDRVVLRSQTTIQIVATTIQASYTQSTTKLDMSPCFEPLICVSARANLLLTPLKYSSLFSAARVMGLCLNHTAFPIQLFIKNAN